MSRQKKRTLRKYNKSRKKNNTLRKTRKKRVRKTYKKRMKGGSIYDGLISRGDTRSLSQKITQRARGETQSLGSKVQNFLTPDKVGELPQSVGYLPSPEQIPLPTAQLPTAQPQPVTPQPEQVVSSSSNPSKNKEILKHAASAAGGAVIYSNPAAVAGTALGALGAYGTYKAGQGAYRVIGSAKDKLKSKALIKNIKQCLEKLVFYAVIDRAGEEAILQRLRINSGYFKDDDDTGPKITFDEDTRRAQKNLRDTAKEANLDKILDKIKEGKYGLNINETPEVVVEAPSPPQPEPYFSLPTDDTPATTTATTTTTPATTPTDVTRETPVFDFIDTNLTSTSWSRF